MTVMQQLDIFADSEPVQRANDLIAALTRFDDIASRQAMRELVVADPDHETLDKFQVLCDFLEHWIEYIAKPDCSATATTIATEEILIREQIIPASIVMGVKGALLIRKCWESLARISEQAGIDPRQTHCFAAELYLRAGQFQEVVRTAKMIPGADMRSAVQRWLALGYAGCGKAEQARSAALRFAWLSPQEFDGFVDEMQDTALARDWSNCQADLDELDATWFPAWCANEKVAGVTIQENFPVCEGSSAYKLVVSLCLRERNGICRTVFEARARLKQLNESFFAFYMRRRDYPHSRMK
ncbi:MAG: hypothetical protein NTY60_10645 [Proteobacteria bacterium]|nr:hypothetical protein [Pseudomonadota bacterium]